MRIFLLSSRKLSLGICFLLGAGSQAWAWDHHQKLMPLILSGIPAQLKSTLDQSVLIPCAEEDSKTFQRLVTELQLNPETQIPATSNTECSPAAEISLGDILIGGSVDDPDGGMDQNLSTAPDSSIDPRGDRKWMGGYTGLGSQGFRHMYFGGWSFLAPLTTFQIPISSIGQAPERTELLALKARELIQSQQPAWGARLTAWSIHYIQDLSQPFHSAQLVNLSLPPWLELFTWPPSLGFQRLVQETTRIVSNYHLAYEDYVESQLDLGEESPFKDCLAHPELYSKLNLDSQDMDLNAPKKIAHAVAQASIEIASKVGDAELEFLGNQLKASHLQIAGHRNLINYTDYGVRPDLSSAREKLHQVTCRALANGSLGTRALIKWALQP